MPDADLLTQFRRNNDYSILALLYGRYMELVYAVCVKYLHEPETAKDAVMDIYEELSRKVLLHEIANFRSWLYSVARNHCLMKLRSTRTNTVNIDDDRMQSVDFVHHDVAVDNDEQFIFLEDCLQRLPAEQKQAIDLFYLQQKCYNDIVASTGFEWNKVRSLVQNGRRNLKLCMEKIKQVRSQEAG